MNDVQTTVAQYVSVVRGAQGPTSATTTAASDEGVDVAVVQPASVRAISKNVFLNM